MKLKNQVCSINKLEDANRREGKKENRISYEIAAVPL
jgi:hypothetical protein